MKLEPKLSHGYLRAVYQLPDSLRVRDPLAEGVAAKLEEGRNVVIRGFWRIGKTELMRASLGKACERTGASGFSFDLRSDYNADGLPASKEEALEKIRDKLGGFFEMAGASGVPINPEAPLDVLKNLQGRLIIGIDELIALNALGDQAMAEVLGHIKSVPPNIGLMLVCHRNAKVDGVFMRELVRDGKFETVFVPPISDEEMEHIIGAPASEYGISVAPQAVERLAALSGNKPWEAFTFAYMAASFMETTGAGVLEAGMVDESVNMGALLQDEHGRWVVDNYARILLTAMTPAESDAIQAIATGTFNEAAADAGVLQALQESGWARCNGSWQVHGELFRDFIRAVASGEIRIQREGGEQSGR
ncbi:MAG: hypothetical protein AB1529_04670 [Candidatus Micrarchaeota archaeon]